MPDDAALALCFFFVPTFVGSEPGSPKLSRSASVGASERPDDVIFDDRVRESNAAPSDTVLPPPESCDRCPVFCLLEKLSAAVAALRRLLSPVLSLVIDSGRSGRFCSTAGRLRAGGTSAASLGGGGVADDDGETTGAAGSGVRLVRERLNAAMNLKAVGG